MLPDQTRKIILFEIGELNTLLSSFSPLINFVKKKELDLIEKTALAQVLHSFYNGLENIFIVIAKSIDKKIPSGILWHKELLHQISKPTTNRPGIISENAREQLLEYLGFRHVVRHIYSTNLDLDRIEGLALRMKGIWDLVKQELETFLSS